MIRFTITPSNSTPWTLQPQTLPTFAALADVLQEAFDYTENKTDSDLLIPVAEWSHPYRAARNIVTLSRIFCADLDRQTPEDMLEIAGLLADVSAIFYTTYSHLNEQKGGSHCWRILIELDAEYPIAHFRAVWHGVNERLGGRLDSATVAHPELAYYAPSAPPGGPHEFFVNVGVAWSTQELAQTPIPTARSNTRAINCTPPLLRVKKDIAQWVRRVGSDAALVAQKILDGKESIAIGAGKRNDILISIAGHLARTWVDAGAAELAAYFAGIGWDLFSPDRKYSVDDLASMIERMQEQTQERQEEERTREITRYTAGQRSGPITVEETDNLKRRFGEKWTEHVIAVKGRDCYILQPDGRYENKPEMKENLWPALRPTAAIFGDFVRILEIDDDGRERKKTPKQLIEDYGTIVKDVVFDWIDDSLPWDPRTKTIRLHPTPRCVQPIGHEEVQDWLDCMPSILTDMLSQMPLHDKILPALVLTGSKSSGKTMLAQAVGRIYSDGAVDARQVFTEFNAELLKRCPIVLIDEKAPKAYYQEGTTLLRQWLTCQYWQLNEKFQHRITMRGFLRLILAGNTEKIIATQEEMDPEDKAAFGERLVHVDMSAGRRYLQGLGREYIQKRWLDDRVFAEHVLYLSEHWEVRNPGHRMAVEQPPGSFHAGLMMQSKVASEILYWVVAYLNEPNPAERAHLALRRGEGELRIHTSAILKGWNIYLPDQRVLTPAQIASALSSLSTGLKKRKDIPKAGGGLLKAYVMDNKQLQRALDLHGSPVDLNEALM